MSMRYPGGFIASTPVTAGYPSGVWTQAQAIPYQAQNVWTRDQYWPYTTLLLQGNGTNGAQNNTFLDSSSNNFTITRNGNTTQGSFTPYEQDGYWSNYFDGSTAQLSTASNAAFTLGSSGDFTIESWVYANGSQSTAPAMVLTTFADWNTNYTNRWAISISGTTLFWYNDAGGLGVSTTITPNVWFHVAVVRSGSTITMYLNGTSVGTQTTNQAYTTQGSVKIGFLTQAGYFNGYLSNTRIVKGTAVYTSAFTPSTAPLTAISGTSLLTCQSNRFIDNSTNAFAITVNGNTSVQAFQPFPGATTYSGTVLGGSGYFDGTGDYLSVPDSTDFDLNSTFTIDCWYYQPTAGTGGFLGRGGGDGSWSQTNGHEYNFFVLGGTIYWQWNIGNPTTPAQITGTAPPSGQWNHVAIGYNGTTTRVWVNGVSIGSSTTGYTLPTTRNITRVGQLASGEAPYTGFIGQLRIVKGTDVYGVGNTTITVPTSPLTAVTNTKLLLNFTNAGISDAAVMNDLETVGNAQVSTSVVKYGTGSMAFDGTDDRLTAPASVNMAFGTGDFTVEGWFYTGTPSSNRGLFQISGTAGGLQANNLNNTAVYCNSSVLGVYYGGTFKAGTTPIAANTWTHFALVRNNSVTRLYVNGVLDSGFGSNSDTQNYTGQNLCVGGYFSTSYLWNGYIDDLRITKGVARYITSFTPPPARMPGQ